MQILINRKSVFFLGIFIFLIPFMGLPTFWKTLFTTFSGIFIIISSVELSVPIKKITKTKTRKEKSAPHPKDVTDYSDDMVIEDIKDNSRGIIE